MPTVDQTSIADEADCEHDLRPSSDLLGLASQSQNASQSFALLLETLGIQDAELPQLDAPADATGLQGLTGLQQAGAAGASSPQERRPAAGHTAQRDAGDPMICDDRIKESGGRQPTHMPADIGAGSGCPPSAFVNACQPAASTHPQREPQRQFDNYEMEMDYVCEDAPAPEPGVK